MIVTVAYYLKKGSTKESSSDEWTHVDSWSTSPYVPGADFTFSPKSPSPNEAVQFSDESTDSDGEVVSWEWDLGDGDFSTKENPTHTYSSEGTYSVILKITDDDGNTDVVSKVIEVKSPEE